MLRDKPKFHNWAFQTIPQKGLKGRKGYQPRGKALGGSSAINAMIYIRGQKEDYDDWANLGNSGWAWKDVLPYFKKAENNENGPSDFHGDSGPLEVSKFAIGSLNQFVCASHPSAAPFFHKFPN